MTSFEFYTDRLTTDGGSDVGDRLNETTVKALRTLMLQMLKSNGSAKKFPTMRQDGLGITGTDEDQFWTYLRGMVPDLPALMSDD
ncbi:hypothetical protein OK351_04820 [Glutamicibacter sp. MNS18]|uniref:hypothetical protein n=1 Tax=Glutamicibacter sp. MNS18 TaxID=2989817 RepID=UPI002235500E|nr:hypothetical protein [Glutamicibacter sp. MNS18]MCW4464828.1 hypothetical protein [Glutamicibacter sp. MNS18]